MRCMLHRSVLLSKEKDLCSFGVTSNTNVNFLDSPETNNDMAKKETKLFKIIFINLDGRERKP